MLCSRFLRPPARGAARPLLRGDRARSSTACCAATSAACGGCCATGRRTLVVSLRHPGRHRLPLRAHPQGLHPQRGPERDLRRHRGGAGHLVRGDGRSTSRRWPTSSGRIPTCEALFSTVVGSNASSGSTVEPGPHLHPPEAARRAAERARRSSRELRPKLAT